MTTPLRDQLSFETISLKPVLYVFIVNNTPLKKDHPTFETTFSWLTGWSLKRGSTVLKLVCILEMKAYVVCTKYMDICLLYGFVHCVYRYSFPEYQLVTYGFVSGKFQIQIQRLWGLSEETHLRTQWMNWGKKERENLRESEWFVEERQWTPERKGERVLLNHEGWKMMLGGFICVCNISLHMPYMYTFAVCSIFVHP